MILHQTPLHCHIYSRQLCCWVRNGQTGVNPTESSLMVDIWWLSWHSPRALIVWTFKSRSAVNTRRNNPHSSAFPPSSSDIFYFNPVFLLISCLMQHCKIYQPFYWRASALCQIFVFRFCPKCHINTFHYIELVNLMTEYRPIKC